MLTGCLLIFHSGIISRDINLFKKHFFSYVAVIPGVIVLQECDVNCNERPL